MVNFPIRELKLVSINDLIETEDHCKNRVLKLVEEIKKCGFWTVPIAIETRMMAVMDGHHRLNAARHIGLTRVPCLSMTYENGGVLLKSWRDDVICSVESISAMVANSQKYPIKTTRHVFNPSIDEIRIPLGLLY